jgi:hypothetical protein
MVYVVIWLASATQSVVTDRASLVKLCNAEFCRISGNWLYCRESGVAMGRVEMRTLEGDR